MIIKRLILALLLAAMFAGHAHAQRPGGPTLPPFNEAIMIRPDRPPWVNSGAYSQLMEGVRTWAKMAMATAWFPYQGPHRVATKSSR